MLYQKVYWTWGFSSQYQYWRVRATPLWPSFGHAKIQNSLGTG